MDVDEAADDQEKECKGWFKENTGVHTKACRLGSH